ncbi:TonB-dependent receptor plug domain-containing protein [Sphingomonas immobilis]|uniref:TonB-dependent receptor n=1 Tax=Sphingomonas immobilis TaxID=3063997 RepID=A0ABT9A032_9SPHN|nr:TonB-dependent receptor [Sphingomonas sp. CA1-15]MDO7843194.1 TonB-dependent receptor [Sphingomonas sp. CA1-15]
MVFRDILRAALLASVAFAAPAFAAAEPAPDAPASSADADAPTEADVIVTGTRVTGIRAADSAAPIELIDSGSILRAGKPDLAQALNQLVPSFNAQAFGGDASNLKLTARLRGLSANHTLILVNGKRRHGSSNLTVSATGGYVGAAAADLSFIPTASIDHVEVLTDGAAAQYGTDAIAGVINIILKDAHHGGIVTATGGAYGAGDGETAAGAANIGFGSDTAYVNLTAEHRYHDYSDRGVADQRFFSAANRANPALPLIPGYPRLNNIYGDAKYEITVLSYNAGIDLGGVELYSFGSYGHRFGQSRQNYRFPNIAPSIWPQGFSPVLTDGEDDLSFTGGVRGDVGAWHWDLASTYGKNINHMRMFNSVNTSLVADTGTSPTAFRIGDFTGSQWSTTLDINRELEVGLAGPLNIAFGGEFRRESYGIRAGEPAAIYKTGAQAYPGFALTDAGTHWRGNLAAYVDLAVKPVEKLQVDVAGRFEHFTDFGNTQVGKITARYDFTPGFALRGTVSTGFRAPTLAEQYYSATKVSPTSAGVNLPANSAAARLLGFTGLKPEYSTNLSFGIAVKPAPRLSATLDLYQIELRDRIVSTGSIFGLQTIGGVRVTRSQAVTDAIIANGNTLDSTVASTSITTFVNGAESRTRGAELVVSYNVPFDGASLDLTLTGNYNETKLTKVYTPSPQIAASGQAYLDRNAISYLETSAPRAKVSLDGLFRKNGWAIDLRGTLYGASSVWVDGGSTSNYIENVLAAKVIVDLDIHYDITRNLGVSVGATNLFNTFPSNVDPVTYAAGIAAGGNGVATTDSWSAFGINGGYYYGKVAVKF